MSQPSQKPAQINAKVKSTAIKAGKYVGLKLLNYAIFLLVLAGLWWYFFGGSGGNSGGGGGGGGQGHKPRLDSEPDSTVLVVYQAVASNNAREACVSFTPEAAATFARNMGAETCDQAIQQLNTQVTNKVAYNDTSIPPKKIMTSGSKSSISSCEMNVNGGKRLGLFILQRLSDGGWIIADHESEPADCITG
ncbi:hypothetical protein [Allokutzneria albata]|uniref:Uncharacterized protein n=1 Tax=Allokutzneria albata TaxID=211114 RepID=A0A1G9Z035_ALLAB|nr:hypothetical protein [Allokutzneria albata]SDN14759.1 hypothetical protein SAMN04489726_5175 [Allokutzneria albata]